MVAQQEEVTAQENSSRNLKGWFRKRHIVTVMLFLCMANAYTMRTNLSVAIVAMVNQTALPKKPDVLINECGTNDEPANNITIEEQSYEGSFVWSTIQQGYVLESFFHGYCITQIPCGIFSKKYGAKRFIAIGMLINTIFGFLVPLAANYGLICLIVVRFIQGLGEGAIVPCTHAMLSNWIPPDERSRAGAIVYSGAQFGTIISMPISGLIAYSETFGWPVVFHFFSAITAIWLIAFWLVVFEDPDSHPTITEDERKYINSSVWGSDVVASNQPIPLKSIFTSIPFWAILIAHIGHNYGLETFMTELPTFMKQVLHIDGSVAGLLSSLPYLAMWLFSLLFGVIADAMIKSKKVSNTVTRKIANGIGHYGIAVLLIMSAFTGCYPYINIALITIGVGLSGAIYSGFKINHLDISPRFAGVLMAFTNFTANLVASFTPNIAGHIVEGRPTQAAWREVFFLVAGVYIICNTFFIVFATAKRQPWDNMSNDRSKDNKSESDIVETAYL